MESNDTKRRVTYLARKRSFLANTHTQKKYARAHSRSQTRGKDVFSGYQIQQRKWMTVGGDAGTERNNNVSSSRDITIGRFIHHSIANVFTQMCLVSRRVFLTVERVLGLEK